MTAPSDVTISNLALDPAAGLVFYSQARSSVLQRPSSQILCYSFLNQNATVLVPSDVTWVSGLVVDRIRRYVYWSDLYQQVIERVRFDGTQRQIILQYEVREA